MVLAGWAMERARTVTCDTDDPNELRFCDQTGELYQELGQVGSIPYRHEFKLAGPHIRYRGASRRPPRSSAMRGQYVHSWTVPQVPLGGSAAR